ncbi:hypothetical protein [Mycolicibacterium xanthum]|uniref:hypothetical protein n=1 Tax=Mycolicibacterium xanthum TaxID=2796469 RepID=UPI00210706C4|nr:hypothetical protein [Mycolicibacterium xanthum]
MTVVPGDHLGAGVVVGTHQFVPLLHVEAAGEGSRVHQVAEQQGELSPFGGWSTAGQDGGVGGRLDCRPGGFSNPDQAFSVFCDVVGVAVEKFFADDVQLLSGQLELGLDRPVRDAAPPLHQVFDLVNHGIEVHRYVRLPVRRYQPYQWCAAIVHGGRFQRT